MEGGREEVGNKGLWEGGMEEESEGGSEGEIGKEGRREGEVGEGGKEEGSEERRD